MSGSGYVRSDGKVKSSLAAKYTLITVSTSYDDSGDLEAGTKTIVAVASGAADYTDTNALTAPSDTRFVVRNIGVRMLVDIDSFNAGCTVLNYSITIGANAALTGTFVASGAAQVKTHNVTVATHAAHAGVASEIRFWVDAGNAVLSKVQLYLAYGMTGNGGFVTIYTLNVKGLAMPLGAVYRVGAGTVNLMWSFSDTQYKNVAYLQNTIASDTYIGNTNPKTVLVSNVLRMKFISSAATDLVYIDNNAGFAVVEL